MNNHAKKQNFYAELEADEKHQVSQKPQKSSLRQVYRQFKANREAAEIEKVSRYPKCTHCGDIMFPDKIVENNYSLRFAGFFLAIAGIILGFLFFWTIIAPLIGLAMLFIGNSMGYRKNKAWVCCNCDYYYPRR